LWLCICVITCCFETSFITPSTPLFVYFFNFTLTSLHFCAKLAYLLRRVNKWMMKQKNELT